MNKKKIKKYFKILFVPITMLLCLSVFLINTFAAEGFEVQSNGDIKSLNLWDEQWKNGYYDTSNGIFVSNSDYVCCESAISLVPNTTYSISIVNNMDFQFYDNSGTFLFNISRYIRDGNSYTFTTNSNTYYMTFYITDLYGNTYQNDIMFNEGYFLLDYFPYGTYYSTPQTSNFMEYLIGENYFSSGRAMVYQTNDSSHYWDREIYPTNRVSYYDIGNLSIGNYINGKTLYLQNLSYDLIEGLKQQTNYSYQFNTTLALKPSFNFTNSSITYLNVPCKFINLDIYCPNGIFECSCYVGNGLEIGTEGNERVYFQQSGDYIHIDFDDDDNRWLFDIEIVLNKSNNTFIAPSTVISNTNDTLQWDLYQIGYDDGFRNQNGTINVLQSQINDLNSQITSKQNAIDVLQQQNEQLRNSLQQNFGFDDVFFALADTPFKTASNMLGFEVFGVNLFNALIGFITVLACIWLLKKFL